MNIKQIEVFVAIVETGTFSDGARRASLTQSTASQHIASLESYCGVRLFERRKEGAVPTEAGRILLPHARRVLAALEQASNAMRQVARGEGMLLTIAASSIPGTYLLPGVLAALRQRIPGIRIQVEMGDSAAMQTHLASGLAEVALLGSPATDRRINGEPVGHDRIIAVSSLGEKRQITREELLNEPLVMREAGSGTGMAVVAALRRIGIDPRNLTVSMTLGSSEAVKQALLAGCGTGFLSELAVRKECAEGRLHEIELEGLSIERSFTLAWRRGSTLSPAALAFCNLIRCMTRKEGNSVTDTAPHEGTQGVKGTKGAPSGE